MGKHSSNEDLWSQLNEQMVKVGIDQQVIHEWLHLFRKKASEIGEDGLVDWLHKLNYGTPEPYVNEQCAIDFYHRHEQWVKQTVAKLEQEIGLPWEVQAEDLSELDIRARKAQLVIRQRVTDIVLDLEDRWWLKLHF
ncbi:hypothetical protein [Thalassobacillus hwangdonensis]|uniref:Uncharacterized protein n=1 Tax=Thalassobacillus hwangdonensis TaxID=546108 RepID=A0ABW3L6V8_9BACI